MYYLRSTESPSVSYVLMPSSAVFLVKTEIADDLRKLVSSLDNVAWQIFDPVNPIKNALRLCEKVIWLDW